MNARILLAPLLGAALFCAAADASAQATLLTGLGGPVGFGNDTGLVNDDGSSSAIDIRMAFPSGLCFFGRTYTSVYINTNGNITFNGPVGTFTPSPFPIGSQPMIAPFWADVDTRGTGSGIPPENRIYLSQTSGRLVITWYRVGYYSNRIDRRNTFQLVITEYRDAMNYDIEFRYNTLQWTTGDASGGMGGLGGTPAQAGFDAGDSRNFTELAGSRTAGALMWVSQSNLAPPVNGLFRFQIRGCTVPRCGNMVVEAGEECDDGNRNAGDGCSPNCTRELPNGERCADNRQCRSQQCVDGVCCESACRGQCEACNQPGSAGRCVAVRGTPVAPRAACAGTPGAPCAASCDGTRRDACVTPPDGTVCQGTECRTGRCMGGTCSMLTATCSGATPLCDSATNTCVGCLSNRDCPSSAPVCDPSTRRCGPCRTDNDCSARAGTTTCATSGSNAGRCVQCTSSNRAACTGATSVCDDTTNTCVGCLSNRDCPSSTPVCNPSTRRCGPCARDADCSERPGTPACATMGMNMGQCVQCTSDSSTACMAATPVCDPRSNTCVGCLSNRDCPSSAPVCDPSTRRCGPCARDADCSERPGTPACATMGTNMGQCVQCTGANSSACMGATPVCDAERARCVRCTEATAAMVCAMAMEGRACIAGEEPFCGCTRDADCGDVTSGRICDPTTRRCQPGCWPGDGHNNCPMGQFCTSDDPTVPGVCTTSCNRDGDCMQSNPMRPYCLRATTDGGVADASEPTPDGGKGSSRASVCVECVTDAHCAMRTDGRTRCIGADNTCARCSPTARELCSAEGDGAACLMNGLCGCTSDADCASDRRCNLSSNRCEARPTPDASTGDATTDASVPDANTPDANAPDDLGTMDAAPPSIVYRGGGCGCRSTTRPDLSPRGFAALALALALMVSRRRSSR